MAKKNASSSPFKQAILTPRGSLKGTSNAKPNLALFPGLVFATANYLRQSFTLVQRPKKSCFIIPGLLYTMRK